MQKKVDQSDKIKAKLSEKQKEITNLKVEMASTDVLANIQIEKVNPETNTDTTEEIILEVEIKKSVRSANLLHQI